MTPLFERPDLTQDDYYRLRHPSRLTAARRVTARLSAAFRSRPLAGCAEQGNLHAAHCALGTPPTARNRRELGARQAAGVTHAP